jgi:hypothetical protein
MPIPAISAAVVDMVIGFLLPLLLPGAGGNVQAATAVVLELLAGHQPQTARELRLAGEAVAYSLKGLAMLGKASEPGISTEVMDSSLKWACTLARSGHQAQRRLDELQRIGRPAARRQDPAAEPGPGPKSPAAAELIAAGPAPSAAAPGPEPASSDVAQPGVIQPEVTQADTIQAEAAFAKAEKLLVLMKAHHKGAPPPHSQAAQQIAAQHRAVEAARLVLAQARRRSAERRTVPVSALAAA